MSYKKSVLYQNKNSNIYKEVWIFNIKTQISVIRYMYSKCLFHFTRGKIAGFISAKTAHITLKPFLIRVMSLMLILVAEQQCTITIHIKPYTVSLLCVFSYVLFFA